MESMDFLHDEKFIQWQLTREASLESFWMEYVEKYPEQEQALQDAVNYFSKIKLNPSRLEEADKIQLWRRIQQSAARIRRKKTRRKYIAYAAAACIIAFFGSTFFLNQQQPSEILVEKKGQDENIQLIAGDKMISFDNNVNLSIDQKGNLNIGDSLSKNGFTTKGTEQLTLVVPYGKQSTLTLPDGTKIWLNSGSVLKFPSVFSMTSRDITLKGEIYIDVEADKEKPFIVHTANFDVQVFGTEFNVSAYGDARTGRVVLVEGKVRVENVQKEQVFLQPNDMVSISGTTMEKKTVNVEQYTSWRKGYLTFEDTPIFEVLASLERYYNVNFTYTDDSNLAQLTCTGKIYLFTDMDKVLTTLSLITDIEYGIRFKNERDHKSDFN